MGIPGRNHAVTIALMLMLAIVCGSRSWGADSIGHVDDVEDAGQATVQKRSPPDHKLYPKKRKEIFSDEKIYTNKTKVTIILDAEERGDYSTWVLFPNATISFTIESPDCPVDDRDQQHFVISEERGLLTGTYDLGRQGVEVTSETHTPNAVICVAGTTYNVLFSPQANTTAVTSFEGTVRVRNPQAPDKRWVEVRPNEHALVVGHVPPIKPKELQDSDVLLSALTTIQLPDAPGPPLLPPSVPAHDIYGERRSPRDSLSSTTVVIGIDFPD